MKGRRMRLKRIVGSMRRRKKEKRDEDDLKDIT